ncbi:prepilin-type N-terminal cleavage/methylation domain-containing protein [Phaeodactylibacter luteus]
MVTLATRLRLTNFSFSSVSAGFTLLELLLAIIILLVVF